MAVDSGTPRSPKLTERRESVVVEASRLINAKGVSALRLSELAASLGMPRKSLYYYAGDRQALVAECFARACAMLEQGLDLAVGAADEALGAFIRHQFSDEARPAVALIDIDWLPETPRHAIRKRLARIEQRLSALIARGTAEGRFAGHDPRIATHIILAMLAWSRTAQQWTDDLTSNPARVTQAVTDIVLHGIAASSPHDPDSALDLGTITGAAPDVFDREQIQRARIERLASSASQLFNMRGIEATSLEDVANAIGTTKGAIYQHFPSKAVLVAHCYERAFRIQTAIVAAARDNTENGAAWLCNAIYLNSLAHIEGLAPLATLPGVGSLPDDLRGKVLGRIGEIFGAVAGIYEMGIADGSIRNLDFIVAESVVGGAMAWMPQWLPAFAHIAKEDLARQINRVIFQGLMYR